MTDSATPQLKAFARQLLACEAASGNPAGARDSGDFLACGKLRGPLVKLIGIGGFRSLLTRAQALGGEDVPSLRALHIKADGTLEVPEANLQPHEFVAGELALVTQLVGLLVTFVGPALTLQLVREIWPELPESNFGTGKTP